MNQPTEPATTPSDDSLMQAYASGDERAFETLYQRHRSALYRYLLRQLDADQAADCFQRTWLKLIQSRHRYRAEGRFPSYLFRIAHNELMSHYRANKTWQSSEDELAAPDHQGPDTSAEQAALRSKLLALLQQLPLHQRNAWLLQQESGLSVAEIGQITGTSPEGVKSRLRYAKEKLRQGLARHV